MVLFNTSSCTFHVAGAVLRPGGKRNLPLSFEVRQALRRGNLSVAKAVERRLEEPRPVLRWVPSSSSRNVLPERFVPALEGDRIRSYTSPATLRKE